MIRITFNSLWSHKRRFISTCIAVVLGVAFMSGTLVLTSTINNVFDDLFAKTNQHVDAIVRGPVTVKAAQGSGSRHGRIPQSSLEKVAAVPGVAKAIAVVYTQDLTLLDHAGDPMGGNGPPTIVSSWPTDDALNDYQVVEGRAPTALGEAVIDKAAAKDGKFKIGKAITVVTAKGKQKLTLVGITRFGTADSAGGVVSVATTLAEAQQLIGVKDEIDEVDTQASAGVSAEVLVKRLQDAKIAPKDDVVTGRAAANETASEVKKGFGFFSTILLVFAFISLFVGAFIISNTFGILVAQRTRELALLRAIGAARSQVLGSVLLEALAIGVISAVLGFAAGVGLAVGALALLRSIGLDLPSVGVTIAPVTAIAAMLVGVGLTTAAAILPAIRATRVPPIAALRDVAIDQSGRSRIRAIAGVVFLVLGIVLILPAFGKDPTTDDLPGIGGGMGLLVLAILVLGPTLANPLSRLVGAPLPRIKGVTGLLARENAMRSPRRTASTASALIIGVTLVAFITVFAASAQSSISTAINGGFSGDYIIQPANQQTLVGASPDMAGALAKVHGVASVTTLSFTVATLTLPNGGTPQVGVSGIDPKTYVEQFKVKMAEGKVADLKPGGMIVNRLVAKKRGLKVGSKVKVVSADGKRTTVTVSAIGDDTTLLGEWVIERSDLDRLVDAPTDYITGIKLDRGTSIDGIRPDLKKVVKQYPTMKLQDRDQFTGSIVNQIKALLNVIYGLLGVSIIIALIGIANTLSLSIHERTRELGLMRAMGMTRAQLRSMVRWEAVIVALMGTTIGLALGLGLSYTLVRGLVSRGITDFRVPVGGIVTVVIFGAGLGVVAALRPAAKAAKLNVLQAISTE